MPKAKLVIPTDDVESSGPWVDTVIQYVQDFLKEDVDADDHNEVTDEVEFMENIGYIYEQFVKLYLKQ